MKSAQSQFGIAQLPRPGRTIGVVLLGLIFVAIVALAGGPVLAQDAEQVEAGLLLWKRGGCSECHGPFANGEPQDPQAVQGPSIRQTSLDSELLVEVIACGRPGTAMPFNLAGAYTETACYGMPVGEAPPEVGGNAQMTPDQLEALVAYLMARIVGQGRITRQECNLYYGANAAMFCGGFR